MRHNGQIRYRGARLTSATPRQPITLTPRPAWMTDPARGCSPEKGAADLFTSHDSQDLSDAAALCTKNRCPFIEQCWSYAVEHRETHNVWGGRVFSSPRVQAEAAAERARRGMTAGHDRIEQALTADPRLINDMGPDERADVIRAGLARDMTVSALAAWFRRNNQQIRLMLPPGERPAPQARRLADLDERVRALYDADQPDTAIALKLGYSQTVICDARRRMQLPSKFGPGGRRLAVSA